MQNSPLTVPSIWIRHAVTAHLKRKWPSGWALDMRAVDASVADDIVGQFSSPVAARSNESMPV
jgi:hypothetical protein